MALEDYKGVFIFAQQVDNKLDNIAFELLGKARDLANDLRFNVHGAGSSRGSSANPSTT